MTKVSEVLDFAHQILKASGIIEPRREAASLLQIALRRGRAFVIANPDYVLTKEELKLYENFVSRRSKREPFQHIAGKVEFWGRDFIVNSDVLVPRSETEMLVEEAITILGKEQNPKFCEIGIGSGCIAVSILAEIKAAEGKGFDVSKNALAVAKKNAIKHEVSDRLLLAESDIFEKAKDERFDLIVSNPPYVPKDSISDLQPEVKDFDPLIALTDGGNGLSIIKQIIEDSPKHLKPNGYLLLEIGIDQDIEVREMFDKKLWKTSETLPDLQRIPRMVKSRLLRS